MFSFTKQEQLVLGILLGTFVTGLGWNGFQRYRAAQVLARYEASYDAQDRRIDSLARAALAAPIAGSDPVAPRDSADESGRGLLNINAATAAELEALPRIGPVLAARILALRHAIGRVDSVEQLLDVPGIGPKTLETIRPYLTMQ